MNNNIIDQLLIYIPELITIFCKIILFLLYNLICEMYRGGSGRGGPGGRGGFSDRSGGRGMSGGRGGPTKRGGPPSSSGPSKRPRFDQPSSQPSNGYATQSSRWVFN